MVGIILMESYTRKGLPHEEGERKGPEMFRRDRSMDGSVAPAIHG